MDERKQLVEILAKRPGLLLEAVIEYEVWVGAKPSCTAFMSSVGFCEWRDAAGAHGLNAESNPRAVKKALIEWMANHGFDCEAESSPESEKLGQFSMRWKKTVKIDVSEAEVPVNLEERRVRDIDEVIAGLAPLALGPSVAVVSARSCLGLDVGPFDMCARLEEAGALAEALCAIQAREIGAVSGPGRGERSPISI